MLIRPISIATLAIALAIGAACGNNDGVVQRDPFLPTTTPRPALAPPAQEPPAPKAPIQDCSLEALRARDVHRVLQVDDINAESTAALEAFQGALARAEQIRAEKPTDAQTPVTPAMTARYTPKRAEIGVEHPDDPELCRLSWHYVDVDPATAEVGNNWPAIISFAARRFDAYVTRDENSPGGNSGKLEEIASGADDHELYLVAAHPTKVLQHEDERKLAQVIVLAADGDIERTARFVAWGVTVFHALTPEASAFARAFIARYLNATTTNFRAFDEARREAEDTSSYFEAAASPSGALLRFWLSAGDHGDARIQRITFLLTGAAYHYGVTDAPKHATRLRAALVAAPPVGMSADEAKWIVATLDDLSEGGAQPPPAPTMQWQ